MPEHFDERFVSGDHYTQTERTRNIPVYPIYSCPVCHYPIRAPAISGQEVHCPYCTSTLVTQSVSIPSWLLAGTIGVAFGTIFGSAILASTEAGAQWLARQAREHIK